MDAKGTSKTAFGECPLSLDGFCMSDGECPYGCDDRVRSDLETERQISRSRMVADPVFVLFRLLVCSAWVLRFQELAFPPMLEESMERLNEVRGFLTPWVIKEYQTNWPAFWADFVAMHVDNSESATSSVIPLWEAKLYRTYVSKSMLS